MRQLTRKINSYKCVVGCRSTQFLLFIVLISVVIYGEIFWGWRFQQEVWGQKPPENQKDIIVIFEELFSVLNMYGYHA